MTCMDSVLSKALGSWCTAIVGRVEHRGALVYERAFGLTRDDILAKPVYVDTRFDLASITKLFVSTVALQLVALGLLTLDEPVIRWFPEWRGTMRQGITARMLLAHTSGMNSGADYRTLFDERVEEFALSRELIAAPGERVIYSDLGMIALGVLIERIATAPLAVAVAQFFPRPTLGFRPSARDRPSIPATERDEWRGRVQGTVHDEKAALMGGASGHAGLFGTAADVAALAEAYLAVTVGRSQRSLPSKLALCAVSEQAYDPILRRGLGWALKTNDANSCGAGFSQSSFGHTGFTGVAVWADPLRDLQGVLLTNSVYFGRRDSRPLRGAFYDACIELASQ
ncbi:MAG: beta-lactamase family protein [Candidatus Eremiobacteraeota bacterium]|nr:beta-lactamase family protein [Candidatus Eremiobacteraeota bacterium]